MNKIQHATVQTIPAIALCREGAVEIHAIPKQLNYTHVKGPTIRWEDWR